jgi:glucose-1-phosphate thymidylyltransferase
MENRIGIIMAGGNGTRLKPLTNVVNKHLLPVYNKPMIFFPLSTLIRLGHKIIYLISKKADIPLFKKLLGNGKKYGVKIIYKVQNKPKGIANCFHILKKEIKNKETTLILGDNLFVSNFENLDLTFEKSGCTIVCTTVKEPQNYGVVELKKKIISIEEKPKKPKSNLIATGLYFFDKNVVSYLKNIKTSKRGEYEITDLINEYLKKNNCIHYNLKSTDNWYDLGKIEDLIDCANFLNIYQKKRNLEIGNLKIN